MPNKDILLTVILLPLGWLSCRPRGHEMCIIHSYQSPILHSVLNKVKNTNISDPTKIVKNTLLELRQYRGNLVQTKEQYQYIYRSIIEHLENDINNSKM